MKKSSHVIPLYTAAGELYCITLSAEVWRVAGKQLEPILQAALDTLEPKTHANPIEPLADWQDFCACWDFVYPLNAEVQCGHCNATTENWETDPKKPFRLKSAGFGGLVVFGCNGCGATVRKKHFKDHACYEFTPVTSK